MELREALARRRMRRSFSGAPVDLGALREDCVESLRAPTAGNCGGVLMHVLGPARLTDFFAAATDEAWRSNARRAPGLLAAGAVVVITSQPDVYAARYSEADKARSGLADLAAWPVPYWHADAAMATMALLLLLEERGLGATIWGAFRGTDRVLEVAGAGRNEAMFAAVLVGVPAAENPPSRSLVRPRPARGERVRLLGAD